MDSNNQYLEEIRRRVDHQVETVRQIERKVLALLRTFIATIGLVLAAVSVSASTNSLPAVTVETLVTELQIAVQTASSIIPESFARVVVLLLFSVSFLSLPISVWYLVRIPDNAADVLSESNLEPSLPLDILSEQGLFTGKSERRTSSLLEEYHGVIENNERLVEETVREWNELLRNIGRIFAFLFIGLLGFTIIAFGTAGIISMSLPLFLFMFSHLIIQEATWEKISNHLFISKLLDSGLLLISATFLEFRKSFLGGLSEPLIVIFAMAGFGLLILGIYLSHLTRLERYLVRMVALDSFLFMSLIIMLIGTPLQYTQTIQPAAEAMLVLLSGVTASLLTLFGGYILRLVVARLSPSTIRNNFNL
jgi:hypothetical protein